MKFRLCGDGDCPDWVLAEIHSTLSVLSVIKLKLLTQLVIDSILGQELPETKLQENFGKTDRANIKSGIACIRYLVINAARYGTDKDTFTAELQQLGLPKEHSIALHRVYSESNFEKNVLSKHLEDNFTVNELSNVSFDIPEDAIDCARLSFDIRNEIIDGAPTKTTHKINMSKENVRILLKEMKTVRGLIDETFNTA